MPKIRVTFGNFMEMVGALPAAKLDRLYENHWTCQAVLRSLPPLAKQYVLRLLYVEAAVPAKMLQEWTLPEASSKHKLAIDRLEQLRVIIEVPDRKKGASYVLNAKLQKQLQQALLNGGGPAREPMSRKIAARVPTRAELDLYSTTQWELVLLQLVSSAGSEGSSTRSDPFITQTFQRAGLLTALMLFHSNIRGNEQSRITDRGFQFLLMDINSQLWQIVREYVAAAEDRGLDSGEMISFLLELGFHVVGELMQKLCAIQPYNMKSLTAMQQNIVNELAVLGLVHLQEGMKEKWFIPTKLAANLSASLSESGSVQPSEGFVVVETNFRVYAYTSSKLQTEILRLFVRLEYQLPNIVVGSLTKDSVSAAFASGINADRIVLFLQKHAHPQVARKVPVVPETVVDQIRLWEQDRNRVLLAPSCLYDDFQPPEVFEAVLEYARSLGGLLYSDSASRKMIVRADLHETMRAFISRQVGR